MLEAFDLTRSYRAAAELAGCSHHTVEHYVALRDAGMLSNGLAPVERPKLIDGFLPKIEEWVDRSNGKVRGDVLFDKLVVLGFDGSDRTCRRALATVKLNHRAGRRRVYRPWIVEPGMGAVGLGARPDRRWPSELFVVCLVGVVPVPGCDPDVGQDIAHDHRVLGSGDARLGWVPDVLVD